MTDSTIHYVCPLCDITVAIRGPADVLRAEWAEQIEGIIGEHLIAQHRINRRAKRLEVFEALALKTELDVRIAQAREDLLLERVASGILDLTD